MILETDDFLKDILRWKKFFIYEKKTLQRSKNTIEQYERVLENFYVFSSEHEDYMKISSISKQYILNFLIWKDEVDNKPKSATSKHSYITIIKSFLKYISENNSEEINILKKINGLTIKLPKREPKGFNDDEISLLLMTLEDIINSDTNTLNSMIINYRNVLIFKILFYGGLRISELLSLELKNIELLAKHDMYKITVIGKGNKERSTYIDANKIKKELLFLKNNNIEYVAQTKKGKIMHRKHIYTMLKNLYQKAGIYNKTGIHILRHTFAQGLVENNINLSTIQSLLGHANVQTTMIYAQTNEKNKIEAIKKQL